MSQMGAYYIGFVGGYSTNITVNLNTFPIRVGEGGGRLGFSTEDHKQKNVQVKLKLTILEMCG